MSIESMMPSNHLILSCPLLSPAGFPSMGVFSSESVLCVRWPKYWEFQFQHQSFQTFRTDFFRIDWLDLLAVQGLFKSINSLVLRFLYSPAHPYMTTRKTIALTRQSFVGKVMSLLFNMLSRLVIASFPRNKCLNFMGAVTIYSDFGAPQNKVSHCFHNFPIYLP